MADCGQLENRTVVAFYSIEKGFFLHSSEVIKNGQDFVANKAIVQKILKMQGAHVNKRILTQLSVWISQ